MACPSPRPSGWLQPEAPCGQGTGGSSSPTNGEDDDSDRLELLVLLCDRAVDTQTAVRYDRPSSRQEVEHRSQPSVLVSFGLFLVPVLAVHSSTRSSSPSAASVVDGPTPGTTPARRRPSHIQPPPILTRPCPGRLILSRASSTRPSAARGVGQTSRIKTSDVSAQIQAITFVAPAIPGLARYDDVAPSRSSTSSVTSRTAIPCSAGRNQTADSEPS